MPTGLGDEKLWLCPSLDNVTPFNDLSDQGNNGTAVGGLTTIADSSSGGAYAYDFDGTNDYITVPAGLACGTGDITMSAWFNTTKTTFSAIVSTFLGNGTGMTTNGVALWQRNNGVYGAIADPSARAVLPERGTTSINNWYHYCVTFDRSGNATQYLNGTMLGTYNISSRSGSIVCNPLFVGKSHVINGQPEELFDGKIDDVRVYDRVLTQSEITHLATARGIEGRPFDGLGDEQLWLCPSLENSPNDLSGNNNNGVYQNGMGTIADVAEGGSLAYDLAVNEDRIEISGIGSNWRSSGAWTISMWIKGMASQANQQLVANGNVNLYRNSTSGEKIQSQQLNPYRATGYTATGVATSVWYHLTCTSDGTNLKMFANGVEFMSAVGGLAASNTGIMSFGSTAAQSPNGSPIVRLDDIRAYDRALTQSEISWLATERGVLGTPPEGLGDEQLWLCPSIQDSPNDLSGNNNNGTYQGGMGTVTSDGKLAYDFDGVNHQYIDTGSTTVHQNTVFSYSVWIKANKSLAEPEAVMGSYEHTTGDRGPALATLAADADATFFYRSLGYVNNANEELKPSSTVFDNTWRHVVCIFDGDNNVAKVYKDGLLVGQESSNVPNTVNISTSFKIGRGFRQGAADTEDFLGLLDDIRVYNRVLTQSEITHLASQRGVLGAPALPEGLGDEQLWLCPSIQDSPNDLSGNGNDGTYNGGMGTVADTSNGGSLAYDFDGVDDYLDLNDPWNFAGNYSYSLWFNKDSGQSVQVIGNRDANVDGWMVYIGGTNNLAVYNDATQTLGSAAIVGNSTWYCITVTYDGTNLKLYVDGTLVSSVASAQQTASTRNAEIGRYTNNVTFNGLVDDVRIYNRVLTQAEITHLASQRGVLGPAGGGPPASVFFNPFSSKTFHPFNNKRIR